jgi:hypothetical protein
MESHLAKYRSLIPTLALLTHLADSGQGQVGPRALKQAMAWGEYLESHARRVYAAAISPARSAARALADRLLTRDLPEKGFALRERSCPKVAVECKTAYGSLRNSYQALEERSTKGATRRWPRRYFRVSDSSSSSKSR